MAGAECLHHPPPQCRFSHRLFTKEAEKAFPVPHQKGPTRGFWSNLLLPELGDTETQRAWVLKVNQRFGRRDPKHLPFKTANFLMCNVLRGPANQTACVT